MSRLNYIAFGLPFLFCGLLPAADEKKTGTYSGPGISRMEFKTDPIVLVPGGTFTAGLIIDPEPGHHTYWKGPGIVGVPTLIEWDLPEGFEAAPILWPAPEKVDMVGITANGYNGKTILLSEIQVPDTLPKKVYHFGAKVAWMSCSTSCNPGVTRLSFSMPARAAWNGETKDPDVTALFDSVRDRLPSTMPDNWRVNVRLENENLVVLTVTAPAIDHLQADGIDFFCDDMQVNSDEPTDFSWVNEKTGTFELRMVRPDFAPANPEQFSGVIKGDHPWPGTESRFINISVPWPDDTFPDE